MPTTTSRQFLVTVLTLGALSAFGPLSVDMYLPAFPSIAQGLYVSLSTVQYSLTSFFIGFALGQSFYGPLMDKYGRKKPLYAGLVIYAIASIGCALSPNIESLIIMRFFQALGACAGMVGARAVVRDLFNEQDSARVFSLLMLVMGAAPILAPLIGAYVSLQFGWPAIFLLVSALSFMCLFSTIFFLPDTRSPNPDIKLSDSFSVYARIFRNKKFLGFVLAGAFVQSGMFAYITGSPFVFIKLYGIKEEYYGWIFGSNAIGLIAASQINVVLLRKRTPMQILNVAFWILCLSSAALFTAALLHLSFIFLLAPLFIYISTLGITFANTTASALAQERERVGSASALLGTLQFSLAAISSSLVSFLHNDTSLPMAGVISACGFISLMIFLNLKKHDTRQQQ